jgi:hypothetical protein
MTIFHGELDKLPDIIKNVESATEDIGEYRKEGV